MRRVFLIATAVLAVGLLTYGSSGTSAQGQSIHAGITSGEKLRIALDPDRSSYNCTVIEVRGDFLGCHIDSPGIGQPALERWYNLRLIARIERPARQP